MTATNVSFDGTGNVALQLAGTLAVLNGGTGSTTAAGARTNLGAAALAGNSAQDFSTKNLTVYGSVGIGTTAPGRKLVVQTDTGPSSYAAHFRQSGTTVGNSTLIGFSVEAGGWSKGAIGFKRTGSYDTGDLVFLNRSVSTDSTSATTENDTIMVITSAGNVGIGTTTPSTKLSVVGDTTLQGNDIILGDGSNTTFMRFNGAVPHYFYTANSGSSLQMGTGGRVTDLVIANSGNVGIGTTAPGEKLEVNGNVKATSFIGPLTGNASTATTLATSRTI